MQVEFSAIEVPGEANPLSEASLHHVLRSASSSDTTQIRSGTLQLEQWQSAKSFFPMLQSVYLNRNLPREVRHLALIQFSNGIDKCWRRTTSSSAVDKEDKEIVRSRLLQADSLSEPDQRLAFQYAIIVAKIARVLYPNEWPDLFKDLLHIIRATAQSEPLVFSRSLLILLRIIKELSTARLARSKTALQAMAPEILAVVGQLYVEKVQSWHSSLAAGGNDTGAVQGLDSGLLAIKTLRRLLIHGFEDPHREKQVQDFWTTAQSLFAETFLPIIQHQDAPLSPEARKLVEQHIRQLSKLFATMAAGKPVAFVILPNSLPFVLNWWNLAVQLADTWISMTEPVDGDPKGSVIEHLILKALQTVRSCLRMIFYPIKSLKFQQAEDKEDKANALAAVRSHMLVDTLLQEMVGNLLQKFFLFREVDRVLWETEPDEWERNEEIEEGWEFLIRPCAEKLFLDLVKNCREVVIEPLLTVFHQIAAPTNENIQLKDALYNAVGIAADVLTDKLDFDSFLRNTLTVEVNLQNPGYKVIRRRIAVVISQWAPVKMDASSWPLVYEIFQHLLDPSDALNDQVVRLTAGRKFAQVMDCWEARTEDFVPYSGTILQRLSGLIQEIDSLDTQLALLATLTQIVGHLGPYLTPFARDLVMFLSPFWGAAGDEWAMKTQILVLLTAIIGAIQSESCDFHADCLGLVLDALSSDEDGRIAIHEDAMILWDAVVEQMPSPPHQSPGVFFELAAIFPTVIKRYPDQPYPWGIAEKYLLLSPETILKDEVRHPLLETVGSYMEMMHHDVVHSRCQLMSAMISAGERIGGEPGVRAIAQDLMSTNCLPVLMHALHGSWEWKHEASALRTMPKHAVAGRDETEYLSLLARLVMASPTVFLETLCPSFREKFELDWLLDEWFEHVSDGIEFPADDKLMALALTRLLETGAPFILGRLQDLMTMWTSVLGRLVDETALGADSLYWTEAQHHEPDVPESAGERRAREKTYADPIHAINLVTFIKAHLDVAPQLAGGQDAFNGEWLARVESVVLKEFTEVLTRCMGPQ
ncbi:ARM repeat-containing protein [Sporormia fimetaria CBS 119925]|uniref:ARM repeat-containing protein n=1 Tax=Sporormia fimetaria CBS 119925 TaxID=1340428 RepID=A0A6A6UZV2_9PLEO|nr:ARM repeat-containing protein [Sporormia fimetaria CBS 119925]